MVSDTATLAQMMGVDIDRNGGELMVEVSLGAEITLRRTLATLSDAAVVSMIHAVEAAYPDEACGFLLADGEARVVTNVAPDPRHAYEIAPEDVLGLHREGRDIIGVFHSHPDGVAAPSVTDLAQARPGWTYVIVATCGRTITDAQVFLG